MPMYNVSSKQSINWNAKGHERILQNISNLLNTYRYEVAYDRILGRDSSNLDKPKNKLVPAIIAETYELVEEYEPRAKVKNVEVLNNNGEFAIEVVVEVE